MDKYRDNDIMKRSNRQVFQALILVFQFGINMLVPIFMCSLFGIWLGEKTNHSWMMIPFFFIGALAGGTNVYKMSKRFLKDEHKDDRHVKKD